MNKNYKEVSAMFGLDKIFEGINFPIKKKEKKKSLLRELKDSPENFIFIAYVENDTVVVQIKKKS